jgi:hypothetical protein
MAAQRKRARLGAVETSARSRAEMWYAVSGYWLTGAGVRIFHYDLVTGELFSTGSNFFNKLPGAACRFRAPAGSSSTNKDASSTTSGPTAPQRSRSCAPRSG